MFGLPGERPGDDAGGQLPQRTVWPAPVTYGAAESDSIPLASPAVYSHPRATPWPGLTPFQTPSWAAG